MDFGVCGKRIFRVVDAGDKKEFGCVVGRLLPDMRVEL